MHHSPHSLGLAALLAAGVLHFSSHPVCAQQAEEDKPRTVKQAQAAFTKADKALNAVWAEAKKALPAETFEELKEEQLAWLVYRDYLALSPQYAGAPQDEAVARKSAEYLDAAAFLMEDRTEWIKGFMKEDTENLTGVWSDSYGGRIEMVEKGGKLHFVLEVVRGPTSHLGGIAGTGTWNRPLGWYSDEGKESDEGKPMNLAFVMRGRKLEVIGANTSAYHGARAYFDGKYVKTLEVLDAKAQARVVKAAKEGAVPEPE